jgi:predicted NBD/HSP70 family sugar kinase
VVDPSGEVVEAANLGWHDLPLSHQLSAALDLPVHVVNDANAATLGEYAFGDESTDNLLLVKVGKGVGAGLLIDGRLFTGDRFAAGEIGHVTVDERGELCACGRRGCLETAIAVPRLRRRLAEAPDERSRHRVLEAAGRRLGLALATVVSALNLDDVVLSGPADVLSEPFRAAALATIRRRTIASVGEHVSLRYDSLGDDDVLLGAAVLVRSAELGVA